MESQGGIFDLLEVELPPEPAKPEKVITATTLYIGYCMATWRYKVSLQLLKNIS